ncbi:HAMP domain-containing protein [Spirillospora sp. NPDC049024]
MLRVPSPLRFRERAPGRGPGNGAPALDHAAAAASWYVSRLLTRPLARLATAARALAAGDRSARAGASAPGELGELVTAFDRMADELNRAELGRRRLAADVAHELRTPLAGAVARDAVAAHGGTVTASSPDAGGATFTIRLPVRR